MFYAELHCLTHFSFQRGASSPEELVRRAWALGYAALAITDECSVAGVVRAWQALSELEGTRSGDEEELALLHAARAALGAAGPMRLLYGSEFRFRSAREPAEQGTLVALARDLAGWGDLCGFITQCRAAAPKGEYRLPPLAQALALLPGCELLWAPARAAPVAHDFIAASACPISAGGHFGSISALLAELHGDADDALWLAALHDLSAASGLPLAAAGDVQMHVRARKRLHDVLCAIRLGRPVHACGFDLQPNAERHLHSHEHLAERYPSELLAATLPIAARCVFRLEAVRYHYPRESVRAGLTPTGTLAQLTREGAAWRFPDGVEPRIQAWIDQELALIAACRYEMFFLTVHDIVRWARAQGILCQGRGSAANSVVCYCLGITEADPRHSHPLLARFISRERRNEPPDIDVDFEHERREEVIQYIYGKYGRHRAALAATVITWRARSALRDAGAALDIDARLVDAFAKDHQWFDAGLHAGEVSARLCAMAVDLGVPLPPARARLWLEMAMQLKGRPRHLSQHVGGFVLTETPLVRLVPVEPAAMPGAEAWGEGPHAQHGDRPAQAAVSAGQPDLTEWLPPRPALRQVIQWDKDDLEALGMLKVDVLALGMLTAMRRCLDLVGRRRGRPFGRADIPREDEATYEMIQRADTVGTFQIESRAQMSMLPRLKPATFYDLVVQVAIVRPGPITGGMVHPYLKARERWRREQTYACERSAHEPPGAEPALDKALKRTLGIPIFQEQVMEIAIIAAGFTPGEADELRRSMAAWKRSGGVHKFEAPLKEGLRQRGYSADFADRIFQQILGFGEYGFPESHAYSFALIAYESSWLKCHEPEAFLAAMLNSQPMGFYGPAQLIHDAQRHGVQVLPPDVTASDWDCTLSESVSKLGSDHDFLESNRPPASIHQALAATKTEANDLARPAVRLGLRLVKGLGEAAAARITQARAQAPFTSVDDLARRAELGTRELNRLAAADALASLAGHRRQQAWQGAGLLPSPALLHDAPIHEAPLTLPAAPEGEEIAHDYAALGLTLRRHPLALLRARLARRGVQSSAELAALPHGRRAIACGLVTGRQQPGTAKGTIFVTLEDETGPVNVIVWKSVREGEAQRNALLRAELLAVEGEWQCADGGDESIRPPRLPASHGPLPPEGVLAALGRPGSGQVRHLIARRLHDLTPLLGRLAGSIASRDFH
ncbi:MAG: PHP domain-containing protein [Ottowia sp.]|uniref:helix-hairpin-helix domain-containing protein n=1 Tax=Ottowia sp. TaxID=1898956 RepID=UPI0039E486EA